MTLIKSETRESYTVNEQHPISTIKSIVIEPRWELLPEPDSAPPLLDMFAADLVLDTAVKWMNARNALAIAGKSNGNDLMREYLDAEELHVGAVALYAAVTMSMDEDEECQLP